MVSNRAASLDTEANRTRHIRRIIDEVIRRRAAGESVDEVVLERKHSELLPELHHQLNTLRAVQAAAEKASLRAPLSACETGREAYLKEEQRLLEESLVGYRILERVEYGGQGVIYRAIELATKRHVALKVLLDGPLASNRQRLRFEREVDLVSRLRHPNIVRLYDSGVVRGRPYFTMEFVEGVPIDDYLLFHRLTIQECVKLFAEVCRAVGYAHQRGVIHRDLKPANILVDVEGQPHILDFGLAKASDEQHDTASGVAVTVPGHVFGTLPYLSPEQIEGADGGPDVRSDTYSLGVVLYRLLTGSFPYAVDGTPAEICRSILTREPAGLRKTLAACLPEDRFTTGEISDDLERVVLKALAKDQPRRYQSALGFAADLNRCLNGEAVQAKADSGLYVLKKLIRRYRLQVTFSAALALVVLASSLIITAQWLKTRAQKETAVRAVEVGQATLDDVITLVVESVGPLAGASEVQDEILTVVRDHFEELMPLVQSDEALSPTQARIHEWLGDIAYTEGRHADADKHYRTFLDVSSSPSPNDATQRQRDLATLRAYRKLAKVARDGERWFEKAVQFGEVLLAKNRSSLEIAEELCQARIAFAWHLHGNGQYSASAEQSEVAASLAERALERNPQDAKWTRLQAKAYEWQGDSQIKLGDLERGIQLLKKSLQLQGGLLESHPSHAKLQHEILVSCIKLGSAYRDAGQLPDAVARLDRAVEIGEYLTRVDPRDATSKRDLFSTHARLVKLYLMTNDLPQAQDHSAAAFGLAQSLVKLEPENSHWRRLQAFAYAYRGQVRFRQRDLDSALDDFQQALNVRQNLVSSGPVNDALAVELAEAWEWLGSCYVELDRTEEAFVHSQEAYAIRQSLRRKHPEGIEYLEGAVTSSINLAQCHLRRDTAADDEAASKLVTEARTTIEHLQTLGHPTSRTGKHASWLNAIEKNTRVLENHRQRRAAGNAEDEVATSRSPASAAPCGQWCSGPHC